MYVSRTRTRLKVCPNKDLNYDVCVADQSKAKALFKQDLNYYVCVADQNKAKGLSKQGFKL